MRAGWAAMPLVPVALALGTGITLTPVVGARIAWIGWTAAVCVGVASVMRARLSLAAMAALVAVAALGVLRAMPPELPSNHVARLAVPRDARVSGRVESVVPAAGRSRLLLDVISVDGEAATGLLQVTAYGQLATVAAGQRIHVDARLHEPVGFRNPGGFDYVARLAREGIHVVGTARADSVIALEPPDPAWPARVRHHAIAAMQTALPPASAALLSGLLLGERHALPEEIDDAFRRAGVYHLLAVSGFNVAILAAAVFALARLGGGSPRAGAVAAAVVVLAFGAVVGAQPSVVRAVIMAILVLAALLIERDTGVLNSLAAAAVAILAMRPHDVFDPGFQLSFAATAGIVLAPRGGHVLSSALIVNVAAQLAVLPITLWHFNQVSWVGMIANLVVVPLAAAVTVVGLVGVMLSFASMAGAQVAFDAVWPLLIALRSVVAAGAAIPGALIYLPAPPGPAVIAYTAMLGALVAGHRLVHQAPRVARGLWTGAAVALSLAVIITAWPLVTPADGRLRVAILDVGQGDAIVVEGPDGRAVVIDAGAGGPARLDAGERVVAPYLWWRGLLRLAGTVVTHDHADHAGGMPAVRARFAGAEPWTPAELRAAPRALGGALLSALPAMPGVRANDQALVLRLDFRAVTFLLASDIPGVTEAALGERGLPLQSTILKVPHHGARDSSTPTFLDAVRPAIAAISVGARNPYRHPDPATLARLEATGARIVRTDRDGAVLFETDGRTLTMTTWATGARERWCVDPETLC
jgi:competence protein ComEC